MSFGGLFSSYRSESLSLPSGDFRIVLLLPSYCKDGNAVGPYALPLFPKAVWPLAFAVVADFDVAFDDTVLVLVCVCVSVWKLNDGIMNTHATPT